MAIKNTRAPRTTIADIAALKTCMKRGGAMRRGKVEGTARNRYVSSITPYDTYIPKIGRNDPCPCGSRVKYKKCCGK